MVVLLLLSNSGVRSCSWEASAASDLRDVPQPDQHCASGTLTYPQSPHAWCLDSPWEPPHNLHLRSCCIPGVISEGKASASSPGESSHSISSPCCVGSSCLIVSHFLPLRVQILCPRWWPPAPGSSSVEHLNWGQSKLWCAVSIKCTLYFEDLVQKKCKIYQ